MRLSLIILTGWLLTLGGCASKSYNVGADQSVLFPAGSYTHEIAITTSQQQTYSFNGVVKISPEKIVVVGLSVFQTTAFRISEDRTTGKVDSDIFLEPLKRHKDSLLDFYSTLSRFLKLPRGGKMEGVNVLHYDAHGIPDEITLSHPKYQVWVKVVAYEI